MKIQTLIFAAGIGIDLNFLPKIQKHRKFIGLIPTPISVLQKASLIKDEDDVIFTNGQDGSYALWDGHAKLADGNFTGQYSTTEELGRQKNEKWKKIFITKNFWLGETEVTQEQFEKITVTNPSKTKGPDLPAQVNWNQATEFCKLMNKNFHHHLLRGVYQQKQNGNMQQEQVPQCPF